MGKQNVIQKYKGITYKAMQTVEINPKWYMKKTGVKNKLCTIWIHL
jgi:hypothetical protein